MQDVMEQMVKSWATSDSSVAPTEKILEWIERKNRETQVEGKKSSMNEMRDWYYSAEEGVLRNRQGSFFKITGFRAYEDGKLDVEQPLILQLENGFLGIICKQIGGVLHFLMQAKIEPGNINQVQISPTIQATKSNFMQLHGGRKPAYLDYFSHAGRYKIIYDQLQSEQSSRFLKKRNRNILLQVEEDVTVLESHCWMTLGQIKNLMCTHDNLVNMDTRTVLSGIPFAAVPLQNDMRSRIAETITDSSLYRSIFEGNGRFDLPKVYHYMNNYKMFRNCSHELVALHKLQSWKMDEYGVAPLDQKGFRVIYCQMDIEGREVRQWCQPLLEAIEVSTFGLICCDVEGVTHYLVRALPEPGCFDNIELGPSIQIDVARRTKINPLERFLSSPETEVLCDVRLSEEGGRFYHEQNRNLVLRTSREQLGAIPDGYFLLDYKTLNRLCQVNNILNIQLRNLLSLLRF